MAELLSIPSEAEIEALIGSGRFYAWKAIRGVIDSLYDMDRIWSDAGKRWTYEYKYRRGGKTLCALYAKPDSMGFMIIFGKDERQKLEAIRDRLSERTAKAYDSATVYHDGKWVMFDESVTPEEVAALLSVKRRPNKK